MIAHYILRNTTIPRVIVTPLMWGMAASMDWPPGPVMWVLLGLSLTTPARGRR